MLCDLCGKNQATVHLTEIVDEQMTELHLCEECARQKSVQMEQQFGLADLLAGLAELGGKTAEEKEVSDKIKCPSCGLTYDDFKKIGRLGCSECYTSFKKYLLPLLKKIHGSARHLGKIPRVKAAAINSAPGASELEELRHKLQVAIGREEFEEAAFIRDQIKEMEKRGKNK
ncbi:MAG: UvrB/UvrC motif-containing protein [Candidatus Omnitrophota bacterium]